MCVGGNVGGLIGSGDYPSQSVSGLPFMSQLKEHLLHSDYIPRGLWRSINPVIPLDLVVLKVYDTLCKASYLS